MNSGGAALSLAHIILYYDGKQDDAPRPCVVMMGVCALCQKFQRKNIKTTERVLKQKQRAAFSDVHNGLFNKTSCAWASLVMRHFAHLEFQDNPDRCNH
jgi:hypothetical protein